MSVNKELLEELNSVLEQKLQDKNAKESKISYLYTFLNDLGPKLNQFRFDLLNGGWKITECQRFPFNNNIDFSVFMRQFCWTIYIKPVNSTTKEIKCVLKISEETTNPQLKWEMLNLSRVTYENSWENDLILLLTEFFKK